MPVCLQLERALDQRAQLLARKLLAGQEVAGQEGIVLTVLSWNLYHGRDFPPDPALRTWRSKLLRVSERNETHVQVNRPLFDEFAGWIAQRQWRIALLQEAPPRFFTAMARRAQAHGTAALTSRNFGAPVRRLIAEHNPDLIASNEGGSNQLLLRSPGRIRDVRRETLALLPERRVMQFARLELGEGGRVCAANLHASAGLPRAASAEVERAAELAVEWAGADPLVFGGDLNVRPKSEPEVFEHLRTRFGLAPPTGPNAIDHILARGLELVEPPARLAPEQREVHTSDGLRMRLSDHAPVLATFGMK
jgi:endonuclease/exonuclease/phosphatase family metal-dependent hydrolase